MLLIGNECTPCPGTPGSDCTTCDNTPDPSFDPPCNEANQPGICSGNQASKWGAVAVVDKLQIPTFLPPGKYVLGWRLDCEATAQVWSNCADITIAWNKFWNFPRKQYLQKKLNLSTLLLNLFYILVLKSRIIWGFCGWGRVHFGNGVLHARILGISALKLPQRLSLSAIFQFSLVEAVLVLHFKLGIPSWAWSSWGLAVSPKKANHWRNFRVVLGHTWNFKKLLFWISKSIFFYPSKCWLERHKASNLCCWSMEEIPLELWAIALFHRAARARPWPGWPRLFRQSPLDSLGSFPRGPF